MPKLAALVREQPLQAPLPYLADRAFLVLMALAIHSEEAVAFFIAEMAVDREGYPDRPRDALAWAAKKSPDARARVRHLAGKLLETDKPSIRHNAGLLLHEIGSDQAALPVLIEALKDVAVDIRIRAVEALADIGSLDPRVVPALESAGTDSSREVRDHAAAAIEQIEWAEILSEMDGGMP